MVGRESEIVSNYAKRSCESFSFRINKTEEQTKVETLSGKIRTPANFMALLGLLCEN